MRSSIVTLRGAFSFRSRKRRFFQSLGDISGLERLNHLFEVPVNHAVQIINRQPDAVIGQAVLRKIISANFLLAAASPNLSAALRAVFFLLFALFPFE